MSKLRADRLLVAQGLAESRTRAQALIEARLVLYDEQPLTKAAQLLPRDSKLSLRARDHAWVSRGGAKLDHALTMLGWDLRGAVALDIGASTGGFCDVLLAKGCARAYAIDVGQGQLAAKLRADQRIIAYENTNAKHLTSAHIPEAVDMITCDASFISLAKVLAVPLGFAAPQARLVALIKPQFETTRRNIGKGGVVHAPLVHGQACEAVRQWLVAQNWAVTALFPSPILGARGNREFLIAAEFDE